MSRKRVVFVRICSAAGVGQKSCNVRAALSLRLESPYGRLIIRTLVQWIPVADGMKVRGESERLSLGPREVVIGPQARSTRGVIR